MPCPPPFQPVMPLAEACRAAGGRALVVGGAVRDLLFEREGVGPPGWTSAAPKDLDVEVHGLPAPALERVLARLGRVDLVGRAFAVYKLTLGEQTLDVSLPRRDSRQRSGHRGIRAVGDPGMGLREAARRRDLTINALALDPLTGEVEDPWGGIEDLRRRLLRAVDPETFAEDPLRALRVPQFAARFRFAVDEGLLGLCAAMPLDELPAERVRGELQKLLLLSLEPSWGLDPAMWAAVWRRLHPALAAVDAEAARLAVDRAAVLRRTRWPGAGPRAEALLLAALLHGVPGSEREPLLARLGVHTQDRFPLRIAVLACLSRQASLPASALDGDLRLLAREAEAFGGLGLWVAVAAAVRAEPALLVDLDRVFALGIARAAPAPLVQGRDLLARGLLPGPALGELLEHLYQRQLREGLLERGPLLAEVEASRG